MNKTSIDLHLKMLQNKTPGSESCVLVYSSLRGREIILTTVNFQKAGNF
jgi:hypothetical protein